MSHRLCFLEKYNLCDFFCLLYTKYTKKRGQNEKKNKKRIKNIEKNTVNMIKLNKTVNVTFNERRKNMKVKKAMAVAAIILLTAAQTMTAQATTQDTSWTFVIDKYTDTTVRSKDNTTPTYICVDRLSVKAKVQVWGSIPVGSNLVWQNKELSH